jgi:hypothetical protein
LIGEDKNALGFDFREMAFDGEQGNRGIAGELIMRRAEKIKGRFGEDVRLGKFAGFDLFLRPGFNNTVEIVSLMAGTIRE